MGLIDFGLTVAGAMIGQLIEGTFNMEQLSTIIQVVGSAHHISYIALCYCLETKRKRQMLRELKKTKTDNITAMLPEMERIVQKKENELSNWHKIDQFYARDNQVSWRYPRAIRKDPTWFSESSTKFRKCNKHGCADPRPTVNIKNK